MAPKTLHALNEHKPKLPTSLKLEVVNYPIAERGFVTEVAETLEELLQAVVRGQSKLPPRRAADFWNQAKETRKQKSEAEKEQERLREEKRRKRESELKGDIQKHREEREQTKDERLKEK